MLSAWERICVWCDHEEVKKKLYPGVELVESVKEALELTSVLGEKIYLIDAVTGEEFSYEGSNRKVNRVAHALINMDLK